MIARSATSEFDAPLLIPLDGSSQSQLLVEGSRCTLQQGTNRIR